MNLRGHVLAIVGFAFACVTPTIAVAQQNDGEVIARSASCVFTGKDLQDILLMDSAVLETPLNATEQQQGRERILKQFHQNPEAFCKGLPVERQAAEIMRRGTAAERLELGVKLWIRWLDAAGRDPATAEWIAVVKRHNPPIASADGLTVTKRQLDAMFLSNDWVARQANLPTSTPESRAAFAKEISAKFASLPRQQKEWAAQADLRWLALQDPIMDNSDLREKAISLVHQWVHKPEDVPDEARVLENVGIQFHQLMQKEMAQTTQMIGAMSGAFQAQNLSVFNMHGPH
jgi:hypothetical protein